ncbi:MAG: hypothetical protein PVF73_11425, partial [Bacteroidales bacterium]
TYSMGIEYLIAGPVSVRAGLKLLEKLTWSFGTGINIGKFSIDTGFEHHPLLGLSSALSVNYRINQW